MTSYPADFSPGSGARTAPRAWLPTDAPSLSPDGEGQFRRYASHRHLAGPLPGEGVTVPSHGVLGPDGVPDDAGRGRPIQTDVPFPVPLDPPFVPDENPTADRRRTCTRPDSGPGRVLLGFVVEAGSR